MTIKKLDTWCEEVHCPQYRDGEFYIAIIFLFVLANVFLGLIELVVNINLPLWFNLLFLLALAIGDIHKWYNFCTRISGKRKMMIPFYKTIKLGWEKRNKK